MSPLKTDLAIEHYLHAAETSLALSDAEAQKSLQNKVDAALTELEQAKEHLPGTAYDQANTLRASLDQLRLQFALGKMEGKDKLHLLEERIEEGFAKVRSALRKIKHLSVEENRKIHHTLGKVWKDLKFDIALLEARGEMIAGNAGQKISQTKDELLKDIKLIRSLAKDELSHTTEGTAKWLQHTKKKVKARTHKILQAIEHYLLDSE